MPFWFFFCLTRWRAHVQVCGRFNEVEGVKVFVHCSRVAIRLGVHCLADLWRKRGLCKITVGIVSVHVHFINWKGKNFFRWCQPLVCTSFFLRYRNEAALWLKRKCCVSASRDWSEGPFRKRHWCTALWQSDKRRGYSCKSWILPFFFNLREPVIMCGLRYT